MRDLRVIHDEHLAVHLLSSRPLVYTDTIDPDEDRPPHVRAGSGIAIRGDALFVVQDDTNFIARVRGDEVTSITLPRGAGGRRRFEDALGNRLDKLDLESCAIIDDELWAFGSGTIPIREHVVRVRFDGDVRVDHEAALYAQLRAAIGGAINIEGVALVAGECWFFHRGNTSATDAPAIVRMDRSWQVRSALRVDLGRIDDIAIGFTDAYAIDGGVVFLAVAEASANAIEDGDVRASFVGVIDDHGLRMAPVVLDGKPEGLAMRGADHAWIAVDGDDPEVPTTLYDVAIDGINSSK